MKKFPVGRLSNATNQHLGVMTNRVMSNVFGLFLEKWQISCRHWWDNESNPLLPPLKRQEEYPDLKEFLEDWSPLRCLMRQLQDKLVKVYKLLNIKDKSRLNS